jgi:hypothetical protein
MLSCGESLEGEELCRDRFLGNALHERQVRAHSSLLRGKVRLEHVKVNNTRLG